MAKNDNLKDFLTDVADAIREKKGTEDKINPLNFADEIRDIHEEVDMLGFSKIGYTKENDGGILEAIDYAYNLAKGWNPDGSTGQMFRGNKLLVFLPWIDTSKVTNMSNMFASCSALTTIPLIDTRNVTYMDSMFFYCSGLTTVSLLYTRNVKYMNSMFYNCNALTTIPQLDTSKVTDMRNMFSGCSALRFMKITNLGKSILTACDFSGATNWGIGSEENRQSLIDSLITYSYDRASNGMATATIMLSANTKALLTEEEIAQITNKGFTIA